MKKIKIKTGFIFIILALFTAGFFIWPKIVLSDATTHLVISEIQVAGGTANDEFIEIYNPTLSAINIGNFSLQYKSVGSANFNKKNFLTGTIVSAHGWYLITHNDYDNGAIPADMKQSIFSLSGDGGTVFLVNNQITLTSTDDQSIVDKVSYIKLNDGSNCGVAGQSGDPAIKVPDANKSIERFIGGGNGNGQDTDNSCDDFFLQTIPNPQNTSSTPMPPLPSPICGNGILESGEECDDGNIADGDGCSSICQNEISSPVCGDGICDMGEDDTNCPADCIATPPPIGVESGDVVINEFYPDPNDEEVEWIELYNNTDEAIDLTGWTVEDGGKKTTDLTGEIIGHGFFLINKPKGILNNSGDLIVLKFGDIEIDRATYGSWVNKDEDKSKSKNNAPGVKNHCAIARKNDGIDTDVDINDFACTTVATPGAVNEIIEPANETTAGRTVVKEEEVKDNIDEENPSSGDNNVRVALNEVFPNPKGADTENEFIELKNLAGEEADLTGWSVGDSVRKYLLSEKDFLSLKISANGFLVIPRAKSKISLNNSGQEKVILYRPNGTIAEEAIYTGTVKEDWSYVKDASGVWQWTVKPTPGAENEIVAPNNKPKAALDCEGGCGSRKTGEKIIFSASDSVDPDGDELIFNWDFGDGTDAMGEEVEHVFTEAETFTIVLKVDDSKGGVVEIKKKIKVTPAEKFFTAGNERSDLAGKIMITEIFPNPVGKDDGEFIEIYNNSDEAIDLSGFALDDSGETGEPYLINEGLKIEPGEYLVFPRSETKIALNNSADSAKIFDSEGNLIDQVDYDDSSEGESLCRDANGAWVWSERPTPGVENIIFISAAKAKTTKKKSATISKKIIVTTLERVRDNDKGDQVQVEGAVAVEPGLLGTQIFYLKGSGIQVYFFKKDWPQIKLGDQVRVTGELTESGGESRIKIAAKTDIQLLKSDTPPPAPEEFKGSDLTEENEGYLLTVRGTASEVKSTGFYILDVGNEIYAAIKSGTGISVSKINEGDEVAVTGLVGRTSAGYRLMPRYQTDLVVTKEAAPDDSGEVFGIKIKNPEVEAAEYLLSFCLMTILFLVLESRRWFSVV